jgi:hypothetical protein
LGGGPGLQSNRVADYKCDRFRFGFPNTLGSFGPSSGLVQAAVREFMESPTVLRINSGS